LSRTAPPVGERKKQMARQLTDALEGFARAKIHLIIELNN
jgi:hypothetical protein